VYIGPDTPPLASYAPPCCTGTIMFARRSRWEYRVHTLFSAINVGGVCGSNAVMRSSAASIVSGSGFTYVLVEVSSPLMSACSSG